MEENQNPYAPPRSGLDSQAPEVVEDPSGPRDHTTMGFGLCFCAFWPIVFGLIVGSVPGHGGMLAALFLITLVALPVCWWNRRFYSILGKGMLTLGFLSMIPIIPTLLGMLLMWLVTGNTLSEVMGIAHDGDRPRYLSFWQAGIVTLLMGICYITLAVTLGSMMSVRERTTDPVPIVPDP